MRPERERLKWRETIHGRSSSVSNTSSSFSSRFFIMRSTSRTDKSTQRLNQISSISNNLHNTYKIIESNYNLRVRVWGRTLINSLVEKILEVARTDWATLPTVEKFLKHEKTFTPLAISTTKSSFSNRESEFYRSSIEDEVTAIEALLR